MSTRGLLSSPSQRKIIATFSLTAIACLILAITGIYKYAPQTRGWKLTSEVLVAFTSSAMFAFLSATFLHFFTDPYEMEASTYLLPSDIGSRLKALAESGTDYKLYVRTGRHFRAEVLPLLEKKATDARMHLRVEVILLDFRDKVVCRRYADYRKYSLQYVQWQIMATILKLIEASKNTPFLEIDLYLSARLSTFRFDGTTDEFIVTREDASDFAAQYPRSNTFFGALVNEFTWVKADAFKVPKAPSNRLPETLEAMFGADPLIRSLLPKATTAALEGSPYGR
jgi:hypothetical protein